MGDIGPNKREYEVEPIQIPAAPPREPARPAPAPQPVKEPQPA